MVKLKPYLSYPTKRRKMELGKCIGSGSFGWIYISEDQKYAIKMDRDDNLEYAAREKERLRILQGHPNIVKMFDLPLEEEKEEDMVEDRKEDNVAEKEGDMEEDSINGVRKRKKYDLYLRKWWIVMEPAQSNLRFFGPHRVDVKDTIKQLFSGLAHIHGHRIIHGDLKLENILVFDEGKRVAICDFGNSRLFDDPRKATDELTTLWYRAPESLAWQEDWDEKIDVWSMGVIYKYLLRKGYVCDEGDEEDCLKQICDKFGYLEFEHPPLLGMVKYWNREGKIYRGESTSRLLKMDEEDKILDACLVPLPRYRKSAQEIVELFS